MMKKKDDKTKKVNFRTPFSNITFSVHYPKKNPKYALEDVTKALAYIGAFDGVNA